MRQSKDLCAFFELSAKNAPICNSLPGHFYENLHEYLFLSQLTLSLSTIKHHLYVLYLNYNIELKIKMAIKKKHYANFQVDFRFEISGKNCIRITLGPEAVFFSQELTPKAAL